MDDPQIAIYVFVDGATRDPTGAARVAGPVFKNIMTEVMRYWNIPPSADVVLPPACPRKSRCPTWLTSPSLRL